jgi:hypothetical protein
MDDKILIGALLERHRDRLVVAGVTVELLEDLPSDQYSVGTVTYTLRGDRRILTSIRRSTG